MYREASAPELPSACSPVAALTVAPPFARALCAELSGRRRSRERTSQAGLNVYRGLWLRTPEPPPPQWEFQPHTRPTSRKPDVHRAYPTTTKDHPAGRR